MNFRYYKTINVLNFLNNSLRNVRMEQLMEQLNCILGKYKSEPK